MRRRHARHRGRRLRHLLVLWFGVTIVATGLTVIAVWSLSSPGPRAWDHMTANLQRFVGSEFGQVWHDPERRSALAARAAHDLEVGIELRDLDGRTIERHGPACDDHVLTAPVQDEHERLGEIAACWAHPRRGGPAMLLALFAAGLVLWGAAGMLARRLTRPYDTLTRFAKRLADGDLDARVDIGRELRGEPAVVGVALNDMATRVQAQLAEARTLLAAVSHEIRTPLGHLRVLVELLRDRGADDATLQDLEREIADLDALVGKLLADARLQFSAMATTPLSARAVATRALAQAGLPRTLLVARDEDDTFLGDPTLLGRALGNLLENARAHGDGVVALRVEGDRDSITFAVDDDGPGIDAAERARAFEPFARGAQGHDGRTHLGLGLALVQRIAQAHGGGAWIDARQGGGTTVGIRVQRR